MKVIEFTDDTFLRVTDEQAEALSNALASNNAPQFIKVGGNVYKTYAIYGIVDEESAENHRKYAELEKNRKAGNWKCSYGNWHSKQYEDCSCFDPKYRRSTDKVEVEIPTLPAGHKMIKG